MTKKILKTTRNVLVMLLPILLALGALLWYGRHRWRRGPDWIKTPEILAAEWEAQTRRLRDRDAWGASATVLLLSWDSSFKTPVRTPTPTYWTYFDHDGNRYAEHSTWFESGESILVRDRSGDGVVDSGADLLGQHTALRDGSLAADALAAIRDLDDNGDGVVDARDAAWRELRLWRDANRNAKVDAGERLIPLEELGIEALEYAAGRFENVRHFDQYALIGRLRRKGGESGHIAARGLEVDVVRSKFLDPVALDAETEKLPDISGYGLVPDLRQAVALDDSGALGRVVRRFVAEKGIDERRALFDELYYRWTGVWGLDPLSLGPHLKDSRMLYALRRVNGGGLGGFEDWAGDPDAGAARTIERRFANTRARSYSYLSLLTHYRGWYSKVTKAVRYAEKNGGPIDLEEMTGIMRETYDRRDLATLTDFLQVLDCYDARGREFVDAMRRSGRFTSTSGDFFSRFIASTIGAP